jgi:hypothetical protein
MLTMLPKLALVIVWMYFSVFAKLRRGVVDAVAEEAHRVPGVLQRAHDALLLHRVDLGEEVAAAGQVPQGLVAERGDLLAAEHAVAVQADRAGHVRGDVPVVAGDHLDHHAAPAKAVHRRDGRRLRGIGEGHEAGQAQAPLVGRRVGAGARLDLARGHGQHAQALLAAGVQPGLHALPRRGVQRLLAAPGGGHLAAGVEHVGHRALGHDPVAARLGRVGHDDGQAAAPEVAGDLVDLGQAAHIQAPLPAGLGQRHHALRQRAGLVGAQHVDGPEVLDRRQAPHQHAVARLARLSKAGAAVPGSRRGAPEAGHLSGHGPATPDLARAAPPERAPTLRRCAARSTSRTPAAS